MNRIIRYISTVKSRPSAGLRAAGSIMAVCVAGFVALTLWGCQRKELQVQEYMAVVSIIDGSSTKSIPEDSVPQINDIAIFAFSGDVLVGYIYESDLAGSGKTIFPMTLTKGGIIDFYVVANSEPGFFKVVDSGDNDVDWTRTSTVDPPEGVTPEYLKACKVKLAGGETKGTWYAPMTNLPGSGNINMRVNVDETTTIPIELTRAVSKVEVWFRTRGDEIREEPENGSETTTFSSLSNNGPSPEDNKPSPRQLSKYYSIDSIEFSMPVNTAGIYSERPSSDENDYDSQNAEKLTVVGPFNYETEGKPGGFEDYDPEMIPNDFYSEKYFSKIWEYYIFPNLYGGSDAGVVPGNNDEDLRFSTQLAVRYSHKENQGEYTYDRTKSSLWYTYYWKWKEYTPKNLDTWDKTIYLPDCERNQSIRVWCALNDNIDRSFTYTVENWDETVTVNVPDFN
ncbi:MAG TPA: hypothetical protein IAB87_05380 [Candidatus Coprenecus merdipullorum]|nr:hypothetical protein [Candidatus Coprenecus merdipullorum]